MNKSLEDAAVKKMIVNKIGSDIEEQLEQLTSSDSRKRVKKLLRDLTQHMEHVYALPFEERECYWKSTFRLYNFLREAGDLGRTTFGYSKEVKQKLREILSIEN